MEIIRKWIEANHLSVNWLDDITFTLNKQDYVCISPKKGKIFNQDFGLIVSKDEADKILIENYCFAFGGQVYFSSAKSDMVELNLLKYIGKAKNQTGFVNLGVHGGYELCSGSRLYDEWMQKATFFDLESIGISEVHTLAGALKFQQAALKAGIKPIIGETVTVRWMGDDFKVKLYVKDQIGWANLLRINRELNITNLGTHVTLTDLVRNAFGLYCVIQADTMITKDLVEEFEVKDVMAEDGMETFGAFAGLYFQFDPVQYASEKRDLHCLKCLKNYLDNYLDVMSMSLICDSYYLDQEDSRVRKILSFIGKGEFQYQSTDQYFKSLENVATGAVEMFTTGGEDFAYDVIERALDGTKEIADGCNFQIKLGEIHLPKYVLSEEEAKHFNNSEDLFWNVIETGLKEKIAEKGKDVELYTERVGIEMEVISAGGFIDYFLILRDIINWCERNDIMVGAGRGSVAGSIVAYLCNTTKVDAIEYGLIFERFINMGRVGKSLPDIDTDFASDRREDVKRYMEQRFGVDNVCSIGTYGTLKTKAAFRDLLRFHGEQPQIINYYAVMMGKSDDDLSSLFRATVENDKLKDFINKNWQAANDISLILGQPKNASVHAAGVVITPTSDKDGNPMTIYDWFPCKIMDGVVVSEWEGPQLEDAGYLKADILGLTQLQKLKAMLKIMPGGADINLDEIDLNDPEVYDLFKKGLTQDVFQFGTDGLSAYCKDVKPDNILDLAAINSLYRPGPMDAGAHHDFVKLKFGKKKPEYDWGTEEILKSTYGLLVYQEQAIKMTQVIGGFSLTEGDNIRKAIGKKLMDKMKTYKEKFIAGAVANGCPDYEAHKIWDKIEVFAGYSFNLSHAVAYSIIGYQTQWIKKYYPLYFWTISLQAAKDIEIPKRVSEMRKFEEIRIAPPDVNKSRAIFYTDWETNTIYWSLSRIAQVGDVALKAIIEERDTNGQFFSIEEFVGRVKEKGGVNRRVVQHLILCGCFDELYHVEKGIDRMPLMLEWCQCYGCELPEEFSGSAKNKEFFWYRLQRTLSGSGYFDYAKTDIGRNTDAYRGHDWVLPEDINGSEFNEANIVTAGLVTEVIRRKTKKGEMGKIIIDHNNDLIDLIVWNSQWENIRDLIEKNVGNAIMFNGKVGYDSHNKKNCIYSKDDTAIEIF